jgi:peptidoglycan DL-endopeptidase CwlO
MFPGGSRARDRAPDQRFHLSALRTARNRKPAQLTLALAGSAVAVAAFAAGAAGAALAGPAGPSAAPHAAAVPAGPVGATGRDAPGPASPVDPVGPASPVDLGRPGRAVDPASLVSPASLISPPGAARGSIVLLAAARTPRQIARAMLPTFHWSAGRQFKYLNWLWERESGWNKYAYNPYSGAYGIPQALPGSKMASAGPHWRSNAATQIRWGLRYIKARYGSPRRAWNHSQATGWY